MPSPSPPSPPPPPILEIPLFNRPSLLPAITAGARRIELNAPGSYAAGGTTPSLSLVRMVSSDLDSLPFPVPLRVMVRPRGGDFHYSDQERGQIQTSITELKDILNHPRGDGFVFGALTPTPEGGGGGGGWSIDADLCTSVLGWARPFPVVFHRAFDEAIGSEGGPGVEEMLEVVKGLGFGGLLTSGGVGNARDNLAVVGRIVRLAGGGLEVVVGGGIRGGNVMGIYEELRGVEGARVVYHSSCLSGPGSGEEVDVEEVRRIVGVLGAGGHD
ncbi:hypothetical protein CONLIGDRAFT_680818 [Coniochaeta ligniaria NRRL 30616]|uniref:Copper homeostasis protein cutC homolog n=1 Tax=Coniochaeta ligniaria NRRL 30616 TaxID=1408157 RepID=A0A1J7IS53_9PEZI|nr:hypothetical protein CONLIGDRAFT_680818 [Coniochaeta ligniaria NRRL 30616]